MAWWEAGARILLAILIGLAIGYERERRNKPAGTRTHILVCLGAALIAVMENYVEARVLAINTDVLNTGVAVSMGRISAQVVSGIGFLGAGTILVTRNNHVRGLTTAAGLWCCATIGIAVGSGFYCGAVLCTVMIIFSLRILSRSEQSRICLHSLRRGRPAGVIFWAKTPGYAPGQPGNRQNNSRFFLRIIV